MIIFLNNINVKKKNLGFLDNTLIMINPIVLIRLNRISFLIN